MTRLKDWHWPWTQPKPTVIGELKVLALNYKPVDFAKVPREDAFKRLKNAFGDQLLDNRLNLRDLEYLLVTPDLLDQFNDIFRKFKPRYSPELFDCDNFALLYMAYFSLFSSYIWQLRTGFAVGMVSGKFSFSKGEHQLNIVLLESSVVFVEPQNGVVRGINTEGSVVRFKYL